MLIIITRMFVVARCSAAHARAAPALPQHQQQHPRLHHDCHRQPPAVQHARGLLGSRRVNPSRDLDEGLLTRIAQQTGGEYFRARSLPELELIYESSNQLEPIELEGKHYRPVTELYVWPAGIAVLVWLLLQGARVASNRLETRNNARGGNHR